MRDLPYRINPESREARRPIAEVRPASQQHAPELGSPAETHLQNSSRRHRQRCSGES
jgi:hypothetical protein